MAQIISRGARAVDRLCDLCHQPMIGIMRASEERTPRQICNECGGIPCKYPTEDTDLEAVTD